MATWVEAMYHILLTQTANCFYSDRSCFMQLLCQRDVGANERLGFVSPLLSNPFFKSLCPENSLTLFIFTSIVVVVIPADNYMFGPFHEKAWWLSRKITHPPPPNQIYKGDSGNVGVAVFRDRDGGKAFLLDC